MGVEVHNRKKHRNWLISVLCLAVIGAGCYSVSPVLPIQAQEQATGQTSDESDGFEEFAQDVTQLVDRYEIEEQTGDTFQTMRLLVESAVPVRDEQAAEIVGGYGDWYIVQYETIEDARDAYEKYMRDDSVTAVQPDRMLELSDESVQEEQTKEYMSWGSSYIGIDSFSSFLQSHYETLPEIKVAVLDTGIDDSAELFSGRILSGGKNFVSARTINNPTDDNGHGTMVSSVLADNTMGNVGILPIKVMNRNGEGYDSQILLGMAYAIDCGVDMINLSLGGDGEKSLYSSIMQRAEREGIVITAAAGNESTDVATCTPANIESAVSVSSINQAGQLSKFSNYGETIDFAAPGDEIHVMGLKGKRYIVSGTSFATPLVTAAFALLKSADATQNAELLYQRLKQNAMDLGETGWDTSYGHGVINLQGMENALENVQYQQGDVDFDGKVTSVDAYYILRFITGIVAPSNTQWELADADQDGDVTVMDVWMILRQQVAL